MAEQTYLLAETLHAKRFKDDDAVSLSLKRMLFNCNIAVLLWYSSFVLLMLQELFQPDISTALLFVPMWLGSLLVVAGSVEMFIALCRSNHLMTHEQRIFAGSPSITSASNYIEYESLPLLRSLYFYGVLAILFMVLCLTSQVLLYLLLIHNSIDIWNALSPLIALNIIFVAYLVLVKTLSPLFCVWYTYFIVSMVTILVKHEHDTWLSWADALAPLASLQIAFFTMFAYLLLSYHRYHLSLSQVLCAFGYCISLMLMMINEYSISSNNFEAQHDQIYIIWIAAITVFTVSIMGSINHNVLLYAEKRGYSSPQQLIKTHTGWRALYPREHRYWPLIGNIEMRQSFVLRNLDLMNPGSNL